MSKVENFKWSHLLCLGVIGDTTNNLHSLGLTDDDDALMVFDQTIIRIYNSTIFLLCLYLNIASWIYLDK